MIIRDVFALCLAARLARQRGWHCAAEELARLAMTTEELLPWTTTTSPPTRRAATRPRTAPTAPTSSHWSPAVLARAAYNGHLDLLLSHVNYTTEAGRS